jgi:ferric-dicitrate binding protein FerR (iron transport regulator)
MDQQVMMTGSSFSDLMQAGRVAYSAGKPKVAHDLWREAAKIDPYNEQVWLALLDVLEADVDKRVCLQNILAINPLNVQARRQLNKLDARMQRNVQQRAEVSAQLQRIEAKQVRRRPRVLRRALLLGVAIGLSGVLFALVIIILLYAPR